MGIEPTVRCWRTTGFEDQEGHQTPFASTIRPSMGAGADQGPTESGALRQSRRPPRQAGAGGAEDGRGRPPLPKSY